MRTALRNIVIRLLAATLLLFGMNYIYKAFFFEEDLQQFAPIVNSIRDIPKDTRILYIGESSNVTTSPKDLDQRSIADLFSEYYPKIKVGQITQAAAHAGTFKCYLEAIDPETKIETVVVTLNLRSFNAEWIHSGLETPLRKGTLLLQNKPALWNRFLLAFKSYPVSTEKERFATVNNAWKKEQLNLSKDFPYKTTYEWKDAIEQDENNVKNDAVKKAQLNLAKEYVSSYAFRIDTLNNPRMADLNKIITLAEERNWNLVFNLMAENVENAQAVCGNEIIEIMQDNRDLLVHYFSKRGVTVVDQLDAVADKDFVDRQWPTEHYNQVGRRTIALNLANAVKKHYPNDFSIPKKVHYHNNCEGSLPWANQHTLTTERAASGKYASKTNSQWEYSLNFRSPFSDIPVKARNKVKVSLMVNGEVYNEKTLLVLDLQLNSGERYWKAIALNELTQQKNGWQQISHTFDVSAITKEGKFIEIYVYNHSGRDLFIDDFDILFLE